MTDSIIEYLQTILNTITNSNIAGFSISLILTLVIGLLLIRWFIRSL